MRAALMWMISPLAIAGAVIAVLVHSVGVFVAGDIIAVFVPAIRVLVAADSVAGSMISPFNTTAIGVSVAGPFVAVLRSQSDQLPVRVRWIARQSIGRCRLCVGGGYTQTDQKDNRQTKNHRAGAFTHITFSQKHEYVIPDFGFVPP